MSISPRFEDFERFREKATAALCNWARELRMLAESRRVPAPREPHMLVTVAFADEKITVLAPEPAGDRILNSFPYQASDELATMASLRGATAELTGWRRDVRLLLPGESVLRASVRMPAASRQTLEKALRYELPRLSPLEADQLYFDFTPSVPDTGTGRSDVSLRILRRTVADAAIAICHAAGLRVAMIAFADDPQSADWRQFPIDRDALARLLWRRWATAALTGLALLLTVAVIGAIYVRGMDRLNDLADRLAAERQRAEYVRHIDDEISTVSTQTRFLVERKQDPMLIGAFADITRLLPDGNWLTDIQMHGRKVRIQGYSPNASNLIALIDKSPNFHDAQFDAPVMQSQINKIEQFNLSFTVKARTR